MTGDVMTIKQEDILNSILEGLSHMTPIKTADLPNINLYMDQLTTFMGYIPLLFRICRCINEGLDILTSCLESHSK